MPISQQAKLMLFSRLLAAHGPQFAAWQAPLFVDESNLGLPHNQQYAMQKPWITSLTPTEEQHYHQWFRENLGEEFDPDDPGYDMRGYWKDVASRGRRETAINPIDQQRHFPDTYKTPLNTGFFAEFKYSGPNPMVCWQNALLDLSTGEWVK